MRAFFLCVGLAFGSLSVAARVEAQEPKDGGTEEDEGFGVYTPTTPSVATIRRTYTLEECLALTDRNHPNLWAARARLATAHAQLDEARYLPYSYWALDMAGGASSEQLGTVFFTQSTPQARNVKPGDTLFPAFRVGIGGTLPLYTFGKISNGVGAAESFVRVQEWDGEKARQMARMDVRKAYFGLLLARGARVVIDDALERLMSGIDGIQKKLSRGDTSVTEVDKIRLEVYTSEIRARAAQTQRGEAYALAALRFLTGVQTGFDIPDTPLRDPDRPLVDVVQYLAAARLFRPEINMARAGVAGRKHWVALQRARLLPDFGIGFSSSFSTFPGAPIQTNGFVDPGANFFGYSFGLGARWSLDFLPQGARVAQAESQLEETRALERLALGGAMLEVENAHAVAAEAKVRVESWNHAEKKAKQWVGIVQDQIDLGTGDERALLEPLRAYGSARVEHLLAQHDYNIALSQLALVSGWDSAAPTGR